MFKFLFIGINRTDTTNKLYSISIVAKSEEEAKRQLINDYILFFSGRLPVKDI